MIIIKTLVQQGIQADIVDTEVDINRSPQPSFQIVGLADVSVQESRERVKSSVKNSGFSFPAGCKVAINLAPGDLRKQGSRFDLPIALGILIEHGQIETKDDFDKKIFIGELSFTGELKGVAGVLPTVAMAQKLGFEEVYVPLQNLEEAALIPDIQVFGVENLKSLANHIQGYKKIEPHPGTEYMPAQDDEVSDSDFYHIKGNESSKRALEIAAAGGHNILMSGPPGSGKSMLAKAFATILPDLEIQEVLDITAIHSIAGLTNEQNPIINKRPFRSVHHTASGIAIVGGGNPPRPGEISLAHRGVLFLDEFAEFPQKTLEVMRQPLEDGVITISRASGSLAFPAQFCLIAAMNPTPSGYAENDPRCTSSAFDIQRYKNKISGPILDRIDLQIEVPYIDFEKIQNFPHGETSAEVRVRVQKARDWQIKRFEGERHTCNAEMGPSQIKSFCVIPPEAEEFLKAAARKMELSGRAFHRILKIARTIADLEQKEEIELAFIAEALQYRGHSE